MRKLNFKVIVAITICAFAFSACNKELDQTSSSSTSLSLPQKVSGNLTLAKSNWNTNVGNLVTLNSFVVSGSVNSATAKEALINQILADDAMTAYGNILDKSSMHLNSVAELQAQNSDTKNNMRTYLNQQINVGDLVVDVSWTSPAKTFVSKCIVHNDAIVWDNLLTGAIMMDVNPTETLSKFGDAAASPINDANKQTITQAKVYAAWYSYYEYWTLNWIWGSERGKVSYTIKIYCYSNGYVYSTDNYDSGYMDLGSSRSESRVLVNSGSYGKIQYALGLATPTGSLSFDKSGFKVSFSGLGSNLVANGTKTLSPW